MYHSNQTEPRLRALAAIDWGDRRHFFTVQDLLGRMFDRALAFRAVFVMSCLFHSAPGLTQSSVSGYHATFSSMARQVDNAVFAARKIAGHYNNHPVVI